MLLRVRVIIAVLGLWVFLPVTSTAQPSVWVNQSQGNSLAFELLKPNPDGDDGLTFTSAALFVSGKFSVGENFMLVGELPLVHGKFSLNGFSSDSETMIGNIYGGLEYQRSGSSSSVEFGARIPVAPDDKGIASTVGFLADIDRLEAFFPDVFTVLAKINFRSANSSSIGYRVRVGPTLLFNSDNFGDDREFFVDYSGQVFHEGRQVTVMVGLTGRLLVTQEDASFGERTLHQFGGSVMLTSGNVQPGVHMRFPIDEDLSSLLDFVFGFNMTVNLH